MSSCPCFQIFLQYWLKMKLNSELKRRFSTAYAIILIIPENKRIQEKKQITKSPDTFIT